MDVNPYESPRTPADVEFEQVMTPPPSVAFVFWLTLVAMAVAGLAFIATG